MTTPFVWHGFDVRSQLPEDWRDEIGTVARSSAEPRELVATSVTSREASRDIRLTVHTVDGITVMQKLPWLDKLYRGLFRDLAQLLTPEPVAMADDPHYGINLNVQRGNQERYECHVDTNPLQGMLYVNDQPPGTGGELVVSNRGDVTGRAAIDRDATRLYPIAGHLVMFDARRHSHYVTNLANPDGFRVAVAMNFYTPSCPESDRPADLSKHLGGTE
jgi:hypothetical protein